MKALLLTILSVVAVCAAFAVAAAVQVNSFVVALGMTILALITIGGIIIVAESKNG